MLLLEQNTIKREQVNKKTLSESEKELKFEYGDNREYKFEAIIDSLVYSQ